MALTPSTMLDLGTQAPDFLLRDVVSDENAAYVSVEGDKGTVILFICNHCPYVVHVMEELVRIATDYQEKGVGFVAISSNDVEKYPADSPDKMVDFAKHYRFTFPYLYDETQEVAKAYSAACTPDIFVFDTDQKLYYRGRMDQSRPGNGKPNNGQELRAALDALVSGQEAPEKQYPSMGCGIKWKKS